MITGAYDTMSVNECPKIVNGDHDFKCALTQCAHLFSASELVLQEGDNVSFPSCFLLLGSIFSFPTKRPSAEYASAGTAAFSTTIGLEHEVEKVIGSQANTLSNVLTLSFDMQQAFDHFGIWFEEVPGQVSASIFVFSSSHDKAILSQSQKNTYHVVIAHNEHALLNTSTPPLLPNYVTFKVHPDCVAFCKENNIALPELLPLLLPSPDLISLRAACARVAHTMSGVAEQIRQIYLSVEMYQLP